MDELKFSKYPSIDNADRKKTMTYIQQMGYDQLPWQVTLKVHGANFCMATEGHFTMAAKRSGWLVPEDGGFHNYQEVTAKYQQNFFDFYTFMKSIYPDLDQLDLHGELFGGAYNHPDVKRLPQASRVQKGVEYCPHNDFYLFDIKVNGFFIPKLYVTVAIEQFDFIGARALFQGSMRECLLFAPDFQDPLHKLWDLPTVEGDNVCEGVVLEPENPKFYPSGSRCILKNKNAKFCEKASHRKSKKIVLPHEWSWEGTAQLDELVLYITENRLRNVLSHIGEVSDKDFGKVLGLTAKDVWKDYLADNEDDFLALDEKEQKLVKKQLNVETGNLIREHFVNIMDGEF